MKIEEDFVFPVYISDKVLGGIIKICKKNKNEVFGYLVGELYRWKEESYIIITHNLYIKGAVLGTKFLVREQGDKGKAYDDRNDNEFVEFDFFEYSSEFDILKKKENKDNLLRLGWWHSHPDFGCFLSSVDLETQQSVFFQPYHVALVVDPIRKDYKFFTLDKELKKGYKEISYAIIK